MNTHLDHVIDEALALVPQERSALVLALLDSLDGEDEATVANAWAVEIGLRKAALRSGAVQAVPWAEARARLSAL
ncbi:hypothetical protein os1_45780 [Comamonadaceae bacterium OS-1]|nr:hypothetical protein os1_45780 [Comamonadaceae bacterium OS-1]